MALFLFRGGERMADGRPRALLRMEGITKHYGGVRALAGRAASSASRGRIHAVLGENGAGKSTLIKILSGVVQPDAGTMVFDGKPVTFADPAAANEAGHRLHLPGTVAAARPDGRRQHHHHQSAAPLRPHRPARPAPDRRGSAGARRRRGHPSPDAGRRPAAVAAPDGRDRQGAGPQAQPPHPRRGDLGADRRGRRQASSRC